MGIALRYGGWSSAPTCAPCTAPARTTRHRKDATGPRSFPSRGSRAPVLEASRSATRGPGTISPPVVDWSADRRQVYVNAADGSGAAVNDVQSGRPEGSVTPFHRPESPSRSPTSTKRSSSYRAGRISRTPRSLQCHFVQTTSTPEPPLTRMGSGSSAMGERSRPRCRFSTTLRPRRWSRSSIARNWISGVTVDGLSCLGVWLNRDGPLLVTVRDGPDLNYVEVWTPDWGRRWITDTELRAAVSSVAWSPGGKTLFVVSIRGDVIALDLSTG